MKMRLREEKRDQLHIAKKRIRIVAIQKEAIRQEKLERAKRIEELKARKVVEKEMERKRKEAEKEAKRKYALIDVNSNNYQYYR